jgi:pimeloyl-ACP methyl ester carboxylesterase
MTTIIITARGVPEPVSVSFTETGAGRPVLLLHGGGGPQTVAAFAQLLAERTGTRVITPAHPGFAGTTRPDTLRTVPQLAQLYLGLLDQLDLTDVIVVGNSLGGWIAQELALAGSPRISDIVLVDAVGIEVPELPVVDFFALDFPTLARLSYHDPERFRIDPTALSASQREIVAANREALAVYGGRPSTTDPSLLGRLAGADLRTLVVWGDADQIVDPGYGHAIAAAIPEAEFVLLPRTGHLPQLESPDALADAISEFILAR